MKIMFVCTGNTCRSAMAEAIFKQMVEGKIEVCSSGILAENGKHPSKNTLEVCKSQGIDISKHKATYFKDSNIKDMDLVLTFEMYQKYKLEIYYPNLEIYTIKEFINEYPYDINDPFSGDYKVYDACFNEICRVLRKVKAIFEEK
ncbi:hypothetical protein [uncultured Methanobrevibacter sp.]|uniref:arsenate reductase/protein-tyrosine-phosphatase family protein n=1 Tax=uncultured Methanobrevibacter sp. TaxID=253161 RepID=UPI00262FD6BA|nr:hypothetical protein [uncultured Methanobrevibacter sp.]